MHEDANRPQEPGLTLIFDAGRRSLQVSLAAGPVPATPVDESWLRRCLDLAGYGALRTAPAAVARLLQHCNAGTAVADLPIAEAVDAQCEVALSTDRLQALLTLRPAQGGLAATREDILAALEAKGVCAGIRQDAVDAAAAAGAAERVPLAQGTPPVDGIDGRLESLIPNQRSRAPATDQTGHTDYRNLGEIIVVHPGEPLMRRHPAIPGAPGKTVTGDVVPPRPGKEAMFAPGLKGVAPAADDPDLLVAAIAGQPVLVRDGAIVEPVFSVGNVDMTSGNIDFEGSIVIKGDVKAGMKVTAGGDIEINGVVEPAVLEAAGDIVIRGGVIGKAGRSHDNAPGSRIRCGRCFSATYVQQAAIDAGDSVFIDDLAMQSEIAAANHIAIGNKGRGHAIGGRLMAVLSITAKVLGSPRRVATRLEVGINPTLHKEQLALAEKRHRGEDQLFEVSKLLDLAAKQPGRLPAAVVDKARNTAATLSAEISELRQQEHVLEQQIQLALQAKVIASEELHDGVQVSFGNKTLTVRGEHGPSIMVLEEGQPVLGPLEAARSAKSA